MPFKAMGRSDRFAFAGLLVLVLALAGCGGSHSRFESYMARGRAYFAAGNLDKASVEFRNALQIEPRSNDAFYFNGRVAERRGNLRDAVDLYQAAVDVQPTDIRARASLAKVFVLGGATQRALEVLSPGLLDHPDDPDLLAARAAANHQLKDDVEARADAERAVRLAPTNENAISVLAALALRSGDTARAISLVNEAVTKAPGSIELREILASVYLSAHEPRKAEEQMLKIIALEPSEITPRLQLANHYSQTGDLDDAQKILEEAVRDMPGRDRVKLALVDFLTLRRSPGQGEKTMRGFIASEPGNEDLRLALGTLLQRAGETQEAIATYAEVVRRDGLGGKGLAARDRLAAIELAAGHEAAAAKLVAEVLEEDPRDDDALIMRASIAMARNDPTSAIVGFRAALRDQPSSVVLHRSLARAYLATGQPALAEDTLRSALDAVPDDTSIRIDLAQVLIQTDRPSQAEALLEETIKTAPNDPQVRESLVRAYMADRNLPAARGMAEDLKALRPDAPEGYYLAGLIAHDEKRFDDSDKNLAHALELQPDSLDILTSLTQFSLERGRGAVALDRLRRSLERDPNNVEIMHLLGSTYLDTNDLQHATETLTRATTVAPRSWVAYRDLAQVRLASNDVSGAIEEYQAALKLAPKQPVLATEAAALFEKQGRIDDAIACYEAMVEGPPDSQQLAANNLAMLLVTYKSDRASLDRARKLTARFDLSNNASFLDTAGWVHFKRREYQDAVAVLERAADHSPDSKVIRSHLEQARSALASQKGPRSG
jgi:tetratricopeptide (TPR) repeat protein